MDTFTIILAILLGYLLGSIPFGFLFVRLVKGVDLRTVGSGRTGGTNSFRAAGVVVGLLTFLMDVVKGAAAVWLARWLFGTSVTPQTLPWIEAFAGAAAVFGHNWSIFLKFKGGAGTGPNVGWSTALWWPIILITGLTGGPTFYFSGMASAASLVVAFVIPITFFIRYLTGDKASLAYAVGGLITALIVTYALLPNIKRILAGEERLVGPAAKKKANKQG
jgi:glycerol-3-phosphate acyltransferase PlsY